MSWHFAKVAMSCTAADESLKPDAVQAKSVQQQFPKTQLRDESQHEAWEQAREGMHGMLLCEELVFHWSPTMEYQCYQLGDLQNGVRRF